MSDHAKTVNLNRTFTKHTAGKSEFSDTVIGGDNSGIISPDFDARNSAHLVGSPLGAKACANANRRASMSCDHEITDGHAKGMSITSNDSSGNGSDQGNLPTGDRQSIVITWPIVVALLFCACLGMALRTSGDSRGRQADVRRFAPLPYVPKAFTKSMYPVLRGKLQTMQARRQRAELAREARKFGLASRLGAARGHLSYSRFGQKRSKLHWQRSTRGRSIPGSAAVLDLQLSRWESGINIIHEPL